MSSRLRRVVLVVIASALSFTFLLIFSSTRTKVGFLGAPSPVSVKWSSYGRVTTNTTPPRFISNTTPPRFSRNMTPSQSSTTLKTLPEEFQNVLLSGLPLECHPGAEGLLRPKYDRFLRTLLDYAHYHHHIQGTSRTLIWKCTVHEYCGGVADRIRGVVYALLLALFSRRRLAVFWEEPTEGMYLHPHMIDWRDERAFQFLRNHMKAHYIKSSTFDPTIIKFHVINNKKGKLLNDVSEKDMQYYQRLIASNTSDVIISTNLEPSSLLNAERNGDQEWISAGLNWCGLAHLSAAELDDVVGIAFRYLFTMDQEVLKEVQSVREKLGLLSPYIALHIRTGFAGMKRFQELYKHPKLQQDVSKWHSSIHCAVDTAKKWFGNDSIVFLATDSNLVKDIAISKYKHRIRTLKNSLVHVDKLQKMPHVPDKMEKEGILVVWVEFLLLSQAEVLVRGESGFSWTAGLVCGLHGNRTVSADHCTYGIESIESRTN